MVVNITDIWNIGGEKQFHEKKPLRKENAIQPFPPGPAVCCLEVVIKGSTWAFIQLQEVVGVIEPDNHFSSHHLWLVAVFS